MIENQTLKALAFTVGVKLAQPILILPVTQLLSKTKGKKACVLTCLLIL